jgi:alpha-ketoglutarate-dependent taurine dioxygenase
MLSHQKDLVYGIGLFSFPNIWEENLFRIQEILGDFFGHGDALNFSDSLDEISLRREILSIPYFNELQQQIKWLQRSGYCAILIEKLGLSCFPELERTQLLCALSLALGYPTPTDPREGRLLWDVKARPLPKGHFATFSEHSDRADLHTDTQYYTQPENYFLLYSIRAARCGGGKSILCNGREVQAQLLETQEGQEAYDVLSSYLFPFRIPTTFTQSGNVNVIETTLAPIFSAEPLIRFRMDTLEKGFQARPDLNTAEARAALKAFIHTLENKVKVLKHSLADDDLMICDNHTALHGRTVYLDQHRHLIRVRMGAKPVNQQLASLPSLQDRLEQQQSQERIAV